MKITSLAVSTLLASTAVAVPATLKDKIRAKRTQRRVGTLRKSTTTNGHLNGGVNADYDSTDYDSNWAGAVVTTTGVTQVVGTWTVPDVSAPAGGSSGDDYGAAIWVGIDGDSCESAILQTGITMTIEDGQASYYGWYEWYPEASTGFSDFQVGAGDQIRASVVATSSTSGSATLENLSTGQMVVEYFTNMGEVGSLCQYDAEWIVEDFEENGGQVPFADFGSVAFSDAYYAAGGSSYGVSGANVLDIESGGGDILTDCGTSGATSVVCSYTGSASSE